MQYSQVLISIGILVISFLAGLAFNYTIATKSKPEKKAEMNTLISFVINFVLFIWLGKVLINLPLLFSDPFVVLARPSDSKAFYVAVGLIMINVIYHKLKHKLDVMELLHNFLVFFIAASFMNEFIKIIVLGNSNTWEYLTFLLVMIIVIVLIYDQITRNHFIYLISAIWLIGQFVLGFISSYIIVFTYLISNVFLIVCFIGLLILIGYQWKKTSLIDD